VTHDHEHSFWRTPAGGLECACGTSRRPFHPFPPRDPSPDEQAEIDRFGIFEDEELAA